MADRLSIHPGAFGVILIGLIFIGIFFVIQFIVPIILWIFRKVTKIPYTGQELLEILNENNHDQTPSITFQSRQNKSPCFAYQKKTQTIAFTKKTRDQADLDVVFKIFSSLAFTDEKRHQIFHFSGQLWCLLVLSIIPYLCAIAIFLLIYLPDPSVFKNIAGNAYYLSAEALSIVSFFIILIIIIGGTFALQPIEAAFEEYLKIINNRALESMVMGHYRWCSYLPFSWRLII